MTKRIFAIAMVMVMAFTSLAYAVEARYPTVLPSLSFSGTTATCRVMITPDKPTEKVTAAVSLWDGNTCIKSWNTSATGTLNFSRSCTVTKGKTYKMSVTYAIAGVGYPTIYKMSTA